MIKTSIDGFLKIDMRVGTVVDVKVFEKVHNPSWKLWVDFGDEIGIKKSSAQITKHYDIDDLLGRQVLGVVNFPPRQIANFMSEVLVLGVPSDDGEIVLIGPERPVPNGGRLH